MSGFARGRPGVTVAAVILFDDRRPNVAARIRRRHFVARLQTVKTNSNPLLLKGEHGPHGERGASGRYDRLRDTAFEYAWLSTQVGL